MDATASPTQWFCRWCGETTLNCHPHITTIDHNVMIVNFATKIWDGLGNTCSSWYFCLLAPVKFERFSGNVNRLPLAKNPGKNSIDNVHIILSFSHRYYMAAVLWVHTVAVSQKFLISHSEVGTSCAVVPDSTLVMYCEILDEVGKCQPPNSDIWNRMVLLTFNKGMFISMSVSHMILLG